MRRCVTFVAAAAIVALTACGGGGPSRREVVEPIVSTEVPARFESFATTVADVSTAVTAWCEQGAPAPSTEIATALEEWYALKPFWFGPVMDRRAQFLVNFRIDPEGIDELLASDEAVDPDSLRTLVGADQRGLGALALLVTGEPDERRCEYARGIADLVAEEARAVAGDWAVYGPALVTDDTTANGAIRDIVSNAAFALREVAMDPAPEIERGLIEGARLAMLGESGDAGLSPLLSDELVARLSDELAAGDAEAAELSLSVDAVSELGITLNFSDADGDG